MKNLSDLRTDIDQIDSQILQLLSRRAQIAIELARLKRDSGAPLHSPEREDQVLSRVIQQNSGPLDMHSIRQIFRLIIRETRRAEQSAGAELAAAHRPGGGRQ